MNPSSIALIVHFLGLFLWIGGATTCAWIAASLVSSGETKALSSVRSALLAIVLPGMLLAILGGLGRLIPNWSTHYAHAPWMHIKLALGFALAAVHGVLVGRLRKAAAGKPIPAGVFVGVAVAYVVIGLIATALAVVQ